MQNVRKDINKAIKDACKVIERLDAEARELCAEDITETEFGWRIECINSERAAAHAIVAELYNVLGKLG